MRNKLMYLSIFAITLSFGACNKDFIFNEKEILPETPRTLSLSASMPDEGPTTRVDLIQDGKNIKLTWAVGDQIELVFVQNSTKVKKTETLISTSITNNGKTASFDTSIPPEISNTENFSLYGVYGGGGLSASDLTHAKLPVNPYSASSLNTPGDENSVQDRKDVMLYFALEDISSANQNASVVFKHLGSLFSITVKNTSDADIIDIYRATLEEVGPSSNTWAYNSYLGGKAFDLVAKQFLNTEYFVNYIFFDIDFSTVESGNSITFWGWYPPLPGVNWPALKLKLLSGDEEAFPEAVSENTQPARDQAPSAGKAYHFYAEWDGSFLRFTGTMTDPRDGNVYKTVIIGNQVWMAENLRFLPEVVGPATGSETSKYYYVYGYSGTSVIAAKATANYNDYGVLYNWTAAMDGSASSEADPSGVQGVCPTGWHLPSDAEWETLTPWQPEEDESIAGGILKETGDAHWNDPNTGATNQTGFTALPGGLRSGSPNPGFSNIRDYGYFWSTADNNGTTFGGVLGMGYNNSKVIWYGISKEYAHSVRCVKNNTAMAL